MSIGVTQCGSDISGRFLGDFSEYRKGITINTETGGDSYEIDVGLRYYFPRGKEFGRPTVITIGGIDGSGITRTTNRMARKLAGNKHVILRKGANETYILQGRNRNKVSLEENGNRAVELAHNGCGRFRVGRAYAAMYRRSLHATHHGIKKYEPDLIVADRDPCIDGAAYSQYYFRPLRIFSEKFLLKWLVRYGSIFGGVVNTDVYIHLDSTPEDSFRRISRDKSCTDWHLDEVDDRQFGDMHENIEDLRAIKEIYPRCLRAAQELWGFPIIEVEVPYLEDREADKALIRSIDDQLLRDLRGRVTPHYELRSSKFG